MAASAKALSCLSGSEARSLRKSARNQTQSNRIGDGPGIEGMIEGEIGEGVGEVATGGRSDRIGEG